MNRNGALANVVTESDTDIATTSLPSLSELCENTYRFIHEIWPEMKGARKVQLAYALHLVGEGTALQIGAAAGGNVTMSPRVGAVGKPLIDNIDDADLLFLWHGCSPTRVKDILNNGLKHTNVVGCPDKMWRPKKWGETRYNKVYMTSNKQTAMHYPNQKMLWKGNEWLGIPISKSHIDGHVPSFRCALQVVVLGRDKFGYDKGIYLYDRSDTCLYAVHFIPCAHACIDVRELGESKKHDWLKGTSFRFTGAETAKRRIDEARIGNGVINDIAMIIPSGVEMNTKSAQAVKFGKPAKPPNVGLGKAFRRKMQRTRKRLNKKLLKSLSAKLRVRGRLVASPGC